MNSYTISALAPDTVYSVMLCLDKNSHKIPISKLEIRTRPQSYMVQLGIVKNYTAIISGDSGKLSCNPKEFESFLLYSIQKLTHQETQANNKF